MRLSELFRGARGLEWMLAICAVLALLLLLRSGGTEESALLTPLEERLESTLSAVSGAGEVRVLVNEDASGTVRGVLIVAQGADDLRVQLELAQAAHAILQVELQNVEVLKMEAEE